MIQPDAQYGQMGELYSLYMAKLDRLSHLCAHAMCYVPSLFPILGCAKQLKMVVLVQYSHLDRIAVPIACIAMLALIVQHHRNGNEKVN